MASTRSDVPGWFQRFEERFEGMYSPAVIADLRSAVTGVDDPDAMTEAEVHAVVTRALAGRDVRQITSERRLGYWDCRIELGDGRRASARVAGPRDSPGVFVAL